MARYKERVKIHHEPSTLETFLCIASMPKWSKLLIDAHPDKPYIGMLKGLAERDFYNDRNERLTIKKIAADLKTDTSKVTKWLTAVYGDIFELNENNPALFSGNGIPVTLYMNHFDDSASFKISLPALPREYEMFRFYFARAKVGTDYFWVHRVEHSIEVDTYEVCIWLRGGLVNKYREFLYDKAMFYNHIGLLDAMNKTEWQIDEDLKKLYKG